ncbi:hypothetical protein D0A36_20820 [Xanthomonas campestris]|nr:hypothetical protein D0A36_20820 [Xanthomonas campestris]RFF54297.1 hypothetical protein D0A41_17365 [Xanthomonas campestris]
MSMSDREIWIPPVPALSDIGASNAQSPGMPGLCALERCEAGQSVFAGDVQIKLRAGSPPTTGPYATPSHARLAPVPIPALRPCRNATTGAVGISARNMPA